MAMAAMTAALTASLTRIADSLRRKKRKSWEHSASCQVFPVPFPKGDPVRPQLHLIAPGAGAIFCTKLKGAANWGRLSSSLVASLAPRRPSQHRLGATRPCDPSDLLHAGSTRTQPAGPWLFWPFAAALLPPLGRRSCSAARLIIPLKSPEMSQEPGLRSGALYKNVHRRQNGLSSGLLPFGSRLLSEAPAFQRVATFTQRVTRQNAKPQAQQIQPTTLLSGL